MCSENRLSISVNVSWRYRSSRRLLCNRVSTNVITGCSHDDSSSRNRDNDRCLVTSSVGMTPSPWLHMKYVSSRHSVMLTDVTSAAWRQYTHRHMQPPNHHTWWMITDCNDLHIFTRPFTSFFNSSKPQKNLTENILYSQGTKWGKQSTGTYAHHMYHAICQSICPSLCNRLLQGIW